MTSIITWRLFSFFPHFLNTDYRPIAATIFNGVQWYSTIFNGIRRYSTTLLDGTRRYSTVFNGIQRYSMVFDDGIAWYSTTVLHGIRRYSTVFNGIRRYSTVFDGIRRHWDDSLMSKHVIYDIGTKILYEPSFDHNSTQKAPFSIRKIPAELPRRDL